MHLVAATGVQLTLGLAGAAAGVEDEHRIFGIHHLGFTFCAGVGNQILPPVVTPLHPLHSLFGALVDDDRLYARRFGHCFIGNIFEVDRFAAQPRAVTGEDDATLGVVDAVGQRLFAKAAVDHAVQRANFYGGEHGNRQFGHTTHIDGDGVTFFHALAFEHIGKAIHLAPEIPVAVGAHIARLAFPDQRHLVTPPALDVAVKRIVDDISLATGKPLKKGRVALVQDLRIGLVPVDHFLGACIPEAYRVGISRRADRQVIGNISVGNNRGGRRVEFTTGGSNVNAVSHIRFLLCIGIEVG